MEKTWWYAQGTEQEGPVPFEEILNGLRNRELPFDVLVWNSDMPGWTPLNRVASVRDQVVSLQKELVTNRPPPVPNQTLAQNDKKHPAPKKSINLPQGTPMGDSQPIKEDAFELYALDRIETPSPEPRRSLKNRLASGAYGALFGLGLGSIIMVPQSVIQGIDNPGLPSYWVSKIAGGVILGGICFPLFALFASKRNARSLGISTLLAAVLILSYKAYTFNREPGFETHKTPRVEGTSRVPANADSRQIKGTPYTSTTHGFTATIPYGWSNAPPTYVPNSVWYIASKNGTELPACGVIIQEDWSFEVLTNDQYVEAASESDWLKGMSMTLKDVSIGRWDSDYYLGGRRALLVIWAATVNGHKISNMNIQAIHNNKLYTFYCNFDELEFLRSGGHLFSIADSFHFSP